MTTTDTPINPDTKLPQPCWGYVSADKTTITDSQGNVIGYVLDRKRVNLPRWSYVHGSYYWHFTVRIGDFFYWGRGSEGISINLRPYKVRAA